MMCIYCKGDDAERIGNAVLCPSCVFAIAIAQAEDDARRAAKRDGVPTEWIQAVLAKLRQPVAPPPAVRPQSLADERHQQTWHAKRESQR